MQTTLRCRKSTTTLKSIVLQRKHPHRTDQLSKNTSRRFHFPLLDNENDGALGLEPVLLFHKICVCMYVRNMCMHTRVYGHTCSHMYKHVLGVMMLKWISYSGL